jgi:selenocysteine-specific elongation factor
MNRLVVGVIGHVDHGKTALVRALTGRDTDRLPEEKERGISIALGFAHFEDESGVDIDLIDMPGHERFVRTMISGATGIDAVLLVVAANEGVQPQTVEHVEIAGLLGLKRAVVAITKADLVAPEEGRRVAGQAMQLLARVGLECSTPILTSAVREDGIAELRQALVTLAGHQQPRPPDGLTFLPIDRAFIIPGHGLVVTGTLRGAAVSTGDMLDLLPVRRRVRVRTVQVHGERVATAMPGQRVALNLRNVEVAQLSRGMVLAVPETLIPSQWITLSIRSIEGAPFLRNGMKLRALLGTAEVDARLRLLDRDTLEPGSAGFAQLRFDEPVTVPAREHVILRLASPAQTVAGGQILEAVTQRQRRNAPRMLKHLEELRSLPLAELLAAEVRRAGGTGVAVGQLSRLTALAPTRVAELLKPHPFLMLPSGLVLLKSEMEQLLARIPALLATQGEGLPADRLPSALPGAGAAALDEAVSQLLARKVIRKRGSQLAIPQPDADRARTANEAEIASRIAETLRSSGLTPPLPAEIATDAASRRAVDRLLREGVIVRCVDRAKGKELLFHRDALDEARRRLTPLLADGAGLLVTEIAAALGISRKFTMPLLDHLDTSRFTRREGDRRSLWTAAAR